MQRITVIAVCLATFTPGAIITAAAAAAEGLAQVVAERRPYALLERVDEGCRLTILVPMEDGDWCAVLHGRDAASMAGTWDLADAPAVGTRVTVSRRKTDEKIGVRATAGTIAVSFDGTSVACTLRGISLADGTAVGDRPRILIMRIRDRDRDG